MTTPDVPDEVSAALRAAAAASPPGQPESQAAAAAWWEAHAAADEAREEAFERLYRWAVDSQQPDAVVDAIDSAIRHHRQEGRAARRSAREARR